MCSKLYFHLHFYLETGQYQKLIYLSETSKMMFTIIETEVLREWSLTTMGEAISLRGSLQHQCHWIGPQDLTRRRGLVPRLTNAHSQANNGVARGHFSLKSVTPRHGSSRRFRAVAHGTHLDALLPDLLQNEVPGREKLG